MCAPDREAKQGLAVEHLKRGAFNSKLRSVPSNVAGRPTLSVHWGPRTDEHELTVPSFHVIVAVGFRIQYEIASFCSSVRGGAGAGACAVVLEAGEMEETGTARVEGAATVEVDAGANWLHRIAFGFALQNACCC
jgi:hypothetical protein